MLYLLGAFPVPDRPAGGWEPVLASVVLGVFFVMALVYLLKSGHGRSRRLH